MTANTKIEWADHTFNPWEGCQKVGPGCDHCYAETRNARFGGGVALNWGPGAPRRRTSKANWGQPLKWNREAEATGTRPRVFCASLADVFDNQVSDDWRADLFDLIEATPGLDWLLLTKRVGNAAGMVPYTWTCPRRGWPTHVRIGATMVNQEEWDRDIRKLLALGCPNFVSLEPLLGPIDMGVYGHRVGAGATRGVVDWVIVGGESGPDARPMHPDWARSLRDQCAAAGVPFLFKQWGEWAPRDAWSYTRSPQCAIKLDGSPVDDDDAPQDVGGHRFERVGKKVAGRLLDGVQHDGIPNPRP